MLKRFLNKLPAPIRSGVNTAAVTFVTLFVPGAIGWLNDVMKAVTEHSRIPNLSIVGALALSSGTAAVVGFVTFLLRQVQTATGTGQPPVYGPVGPDGAPYPND